MIGKINYYFFISTLAIIIFLVLCPVFFGIASVISSSLGYFPNVSNDLNLIPGVVENGLFVNICTCVVVADENGQVTVDWKKNED